MVLPGVTNTDPPLLLSQLEVLPDVHVQAAPPSNVTLLGFLESVNRTSP